MMIDLFCLLDTAVILKFYFYFLGKKPQTGENNPNFFKKTKGIFTKHQNHKLFLSFLPLIYLQRTSDKHCEVVSYVPLLCK